jgi:cytochrome c biogenesis protein CcmG, thiol:disulfide interchange protein DsbE
MGIRAWGWSAGLACGLGLVLAIAPCRGGESKSVAPVGIPTPVLDTAPKNPRKLFTFRLADLKGRQVDLSTLKGHPLVVDFWATWCPPCRKEIPELNAIYKKYRSRGLVVLGLSVDIIQGDGVKSVRPFARELKIGYPILMADDAVVDALDVDNLPTTLFFNRKGELISRLEGAGKRGELAEAVKGLFSD